jgi:tRNA pseudouridine55 synthase
MRLAGPDKMGWMDGVVVLDKPRGISSHDAVQRLRKLLGIHRVGHLGTLDPLATGVLPLVVGKATRLAQFFLHHDREYEATIRIGFPTTTYDSDGEPTSEPQAIAMNGATVEQGLDPFRGRFQQLPPPISAKKIAGVPAYKLARKNVEVKLEPVEIEIYELELLGIEGDSLHVRMRCSSGTYVRSLAHDLGRLLGPGGHVTALRRTAVGEFDQTMAHTFEDLQQRKEGGGLEEAFVDAAHLLPEMPAQRVDAVAATRILHGRDFRVLAFPTGPGAQRVKAIGPDGKLLAIGELRLPQIYHPIIVF